LFLLLKVGKRVQEAGGEEAYLGFCFRALDFARHHFLLDELEIDQEIYGLVRSRILI